MRRVSFIAVIALTVFSFLSVSAQQRATDTVMPSSNNSSQDSVLIIHYLQLAASYLDKNPDSSLYWSEKIISLGVAKKNTGYQEAGLEALKKAQVSIARLHKMQNDLFVSEVTQKKQKLNLLGAVAFIFLLICAGALIYYFKQKKNSRLIEADNVELGERLKNFQADAKDLMQENNQLKLENEALEFNADKLKTEHETLQNDYNNLIKKNEIKDKLIPMIAHDIRSPLATLQNTLALTRDNIISPEEFQQLSFSLEGDVFNLRGMLENMLLWAREQMFEIKINKIKFDISETFKEVILMYRNNLVAKNITLHNYMPHNLEVVSDKEIIAVVVRNLFSNAVKFTPTGKNIYISQIFFNGKAYFSIKDEGKGIPPETLEKLKTKQHITSRGTANEKGTGLGLMFSSEMLNKLNEVFDITSYPDKGTSVTFSVDMNESSIKE
ncbi:MAG: HAMP domain-containing histidine kinase [Bacteroidetes bacterium]|nr:HAMP domain-containing histidine kinase [Bacteroidota bacterium]